MIQQLIMIFDGEVFHPEMPLSLSPDTRYKVTIEELLTLEEAAILLNVSEPYLEKLIISGEIPSQKTDNYRIILKEDILAYKEASRIKREKVMEELAAQAQELDLGY
jgi:excisionase family DNA binding protein